MSEGKWTADRRAKKKLRKQMAEYYERELLDDEEREYDNKKEK